MLDLYKLHIFVLVVDEGSFNKASERLLMTQSAVSQHIQQLEASFGTKLFQRGRRGVTLTETGQRLYEYAERIFSLVAETEVAITDVKNLQTGRIALGTTPGIGAYLLPDLVQAFRRQFPRLTVSLQTDITAQIVELVLTNQLDLGCIEGELAPEIRRHLEVEELLEVEQLVVVGSNHPWWGQQQIRLQELDGCAFIMRQPKSQTRIWLDEILDKHHIQPQIIAEFDNVESIKRAVETGQCLAILPGYAVEQEVARGQLQTISIVDNQLRRTHKLIWDKSTALTPIARAFLDFLRHQSCTAPLAL